MARDDVRASVAANVLDPDEELFLLLTEVVPGWYGVPSESRRLLNSLADASFEIWYSFAYHYVRVTRDNRATFRHLVGRARVLRISEADALRVVNGSIARAAVERHPGTRVEGKFTEEDLLKILSAQNHLCVACGEGIGGRFTVDHVIPRSRGGSNNPANLQLLCMPCNSSKNDRSMDEWLAATGRTPAISVRRGELTLEAKIHEDAVKLTEWIYRVCPTQSYLPFEAATIHFNHCHEPEHPGEFFVWPSLHHGEAVGVSPEGPPRRLMWQLLKIESIWRFAWVRPLGRDPKSGLRVCQRVGPDDRDLLSFKRAVGILRSDREDLIDWTLASELPIEISRVMTGRFEMLGRPG